MAFEFYRRAVVQISVSIMQTNASLRREPRGEPDRFRFGARLREARSSRRLFVPRKEAMSRVLEMNRRSSFSAFHGAV